MRLRSCRYSDFAASRNAWQPDIPGQCRVVYRWSSAAKEHMTAVRVGELDGMLAPQPLTPQSFLSKSPSRGFCFYNRAEWS